AEAPPAGAASGAGTRPREGLAGAVGAALLTVALVAALFLFPYVSEGFRYPVGWDAPAYVGRVRAVAEGGLAEFGAIRAATPLLFASLMALTGLDPLTLVAVVPSLLAGVGGLGAGALLRSGLGVGAGWLPVVGVLAWAGFVENGMLNLHLDNLLNVALVLSAFAAATSFVSVGRGAAAATLLLMGAGLAHWPFYLFSVAVLGLAVAGSGLVGLRSGRGWREEVRRLWPLLAAMALSGAFVGLTFLARPESGWVGARLGRLRQQLRQRFLGRVREPHRFLGVPFAAAGAVAVARAGRPGGTDEGRRFLLALLGAWVGLTLVGGLAQWAGLPTAGARLLQFLFPVPLLVAALLWGAWTAARSWRPGLARAVAGPAAARALAGLLVAVVTAGFALLAARHRADDRPWMTPRAVAQAAAAGAYLGALEGDPPVVFVIGIETMEARPTWSVIKAVLPASLLEGVSPYYGSPADYLAGVPSRPHGDFLAGAPGRVPGPDGAVALVLERYNPAGFRWARAHLPKREVAEGVIVLEGPLPPGPLPAPRPPVAQTGPSALARTVAVVLVVLWAAGSGWTVLLPRDPVLRVALAPALGAGTVALAGLLWDRAGLSLAGLGGVGPVAMAAALGWALAATLRGRARGAVRREGALRSGSPGRAR
ncbi:MAG TPA: hypothetical protein VNO34_01415, partial [Actinomycetota bacterium]|nr:hypothetical protein [Actinomycetota bacterium]